MNTLTYAEQFKNGTLVKPTYKKSEFYKGGYLAMQKRFQRTLQPHFPDAYREFTLRIKDELPYVDVIAFMWDYIRIVD